MEKVNIFNTNANIRPSIGWIPPKVGASSSGSEIFMYINSMGLLDYSLLGGTLISGATYTPQSVITPHGKQPIVVNANNIFLADTSLALDFNQNWGSNNRSINENLTLWKKNLNIYTVSDFISEFFLNYEIKDYKKVYQFLLSNESLIPLLNQTTQKIEHYFGGTIKNLRLKVQVDSEDKEEYCALYLEIASTLNIQDAYAKLKKFRVEWLIPTLGSKILLFNVTLI
jgi:hypothetical protein